MDGLGPHRLWGTSPALDLLSELKTFRGEPSPTKSAVQTPAESEEELTFLVVGAGDIRHVLRTAGALRRNGHKAKVRIVVFDSPIECIARHLILLSIATDWELPIMHRANTFLEVFGNALIQERTSKYVEKLGQNLVRFVCDGEGALKRLVDLSHLKFKDTDALETTFKSWDSRVPFDMKAVREERMRAQLGQRYDHREGLFDWDYQKGIKPHASIIHYKQYKLWRERGVAFEFGDQTYTMANKTMASYAQGKEKGISKLKRGFWSDIVISPFFAFGVDCEKTNTHAKELFTVVGKGTQTEQHRFTAVHVSAYNLVSILHEIETNTVYQMEKSGDIYSGLQSKHQGAADEAEEKRRFAMTCARSVMDLKDKLEISFVTGEEFLSTFSKQRYKGMFDLIWLSNHHAHLIKEPSFRQLLKHQKDPNVSSSPGVVLVETPRNVVILEQEKKQEFVDKVVALAKSASYEPILRDESRQEEEYLAFLTKNPNK